jgi:indolepyruvate ferredoxin oxidoreductase, beta subunit
MTIHQSIESGQRFSEDKPLSVAILAMGGQGGGVLADWIVALAEASGWHAQSTSVPGVAQRTGATIYYIEMLRARDGVPPVLSLMPSPGDVDIVISAELMEAGRSMLRGLVTPERTTLIMSTHRAYATAEKEKPGEGIGDPVVVSDAADVAAKRTIAFDMEAMATKNGSVISAAMFGALAGSESLPFSRTAYEGVIRSGGKGIEASLKAFGAAYDQARAKPIEPVALMPQKRLVPLPDSAGHPALDQLLARIRSHFPASLQSILFAGVKHLVDFQDPAYAGEYLDRLGKIHALDNSQQGYALTATAAKHLAKAMAYDDVIGVADIKTRAGRFARIRGELGASADDILYTTEFMHPRVDEVVGLLPAGLGQWIEARAPLMRTIDKIVNKGRRVRSGTIFWFLALYGLSELRPYRRGTLRHHHERAHIEQWLARAEAQAKSNYDLAVQILAARRLVKGYSDTHARGLSKFDRVLSAVPQLEKRADGGQWLGRLIKAALLDEEGTALDGALKTIATL